MTPERIAEINRIARNLDRENPAYSALNEALDALESAQAEIAVDAGRLRDAAMRVWGEDAHGCDTPDRLADAILGLRAQIADLKRGGVVVPELTGDLHHEIRNCLHNMPDASWISKNEVKRIVDIIASRLRTIPADRVLGEGEARIGMNELQMLRAFAGRRMSEREYDRLEAVRDAHEDALRAQPTQEPTP